jgi:hypothetical protein
MKKIWFLIFLATCVQAQAQETPVATAVNSVAQPTPFPVIKNWNMATVPWDEWFKKNALVTDKGAYVHFFWNAQDAKSNFEGKDAKFRLADAALELVAQLHPSTSQADLAKVDIVYVLERDSYGEPKWDSLQRVVHFEFSRAQALKMLKDKTIWTEEKMKKFFNKLEFF